MRIYIKIRSIRISLNQRGARFLLCQVALILLKGDTFCVQDANCEKAHTMAFELSLKYLEIQATNTVKSASSYNPFAALQVHTEHMH